MKVVKAHALGNDFLIVEPGESGGIADLPGLARRVCERHTGVGADGLIVVTLTDSSAGHAEFRIFNADGSEAEISGNGLRCAAAWLFAGRRVRGERVVFRSKTGDRTCDLIAASDSVFRVRVGMGRPWFASPEIPFDDGAVHERLVDYPLSIGGRTYPVTVVSIGNPHCSLFFEDFPSREEGLAVGREIETHPFFPNRTNVEFVRVLSRGEIEVRFWERGVGETLASGSGASAAAVASILKGLTDRRVTVKTALGQLVVE